jgi:hypothetical protein
MFSECGLEGHQAFTLEGGESGTELANSVSSRQERSSEVHFLPKRTVKKTCKTNHWIYMKKNQPSSCSTDPEEGDPLNMKTWSEQLKEMEHALGVDLNRRWCPPDGALWVCFSACASFAL